MQSPVPVQLPLGIVLDEQATFANFHLVDGNRVPFEWLKAFAIGPGPGLAYLWGPADSGRSHLAQAVCHAVEAAGRASMFLPGALTSQLSTGVLDGLEYLALVCIDDADSMLGIPDWDVALFRLYNAGMEHGLKMLLTAAAPPGSVAATGLLPDLRSRLQAGVTMQLHAPDDDDRRQILQRRAAARGLTLDDAVATYILNRSVRGLADLMGVLERLDRVSLQQQRRLTIALVRDVMSW